MDLGLSKQNQYIMVGKYTNYTLILVFKIYFLLIKEDIWTFNYTPGVPKKIDNIWNSTSLMHVWYNKRIDRKKNVIEVLLVENEIHFIWESSLLHRSGIFLRDILKTQLDNCDLFLRDRGSM